MDASSFSELNVENRLPTDNPAGGIRLGLVRAEGVLPEAPVPDLDAAIHAFEAEDLDETRETRRLAARDMLRNGRYKPTGRGKPASEYLLRAASEGAFPRINAIVDVNNLMSVKAALPISMWDLDRAGAARYVFRLGTNEETYLFNASGQTLSLEDLAVGCRSGEDRGEPIVSPIKDCHATKTTSETHRVAACIYAPAELVTSENLLSLCETLAGWLRQCGNEVETTAAVAGPGETVVL